MAVQAYLIKRSTDDSTLELDGLACSAALELSLLGLLVHAAPSLGPSELGRLLLLLNHVLGLGADHNDHLQQ